MFKGQIVGQGLVPHVVLLSVEVTKWSSLLVVPKSFSAGIQKKSQVRKNMLEIRQIRLLHHCTLHHHSNVTLHYGISLIGMMSRAGASKHLYEAVNNGT